MATRGYFLHYNGWTFNLGHQGVFLVGCFHIAQEEASFSTAWRRLSLVRFWRGYHPRWLFSAKWEGTAHNHIVTDI